MTAADPAHSSWVLLRACVLVVGARASAQDAPSAVESRAPPAVTITAPAAPGGGWDQTARTMQHVLRATGLARSVQVVNVAGAAGTIGLARFVSGESGNGNALLVTGLVMVSGIAANSSPVSLADVTPIARLVGEYEVIVVPRASPVRTLGELVAALRANPRDVSWGGGSAGGTDEILVRLLAEQVEVPPAGVNYIAYSGGGQALAAVLGSHVTAAVSGLGEFAAQIAAGELRALAISSPRRVPEAAAIPTFREQGVDLALVNWRAVVAPPGLTRGERRALGDLVGRMARSGAWKEALTRNGWTDLYLDGEAFSRFLRDETARIERIVGRVRSPGAGRAADRRPDGLTLFVLVGGVASLIAAIAGSRRGRPSGTPDAATAAARPEAARVALGTMVVALALDVALLERAGFAVASTVLFVLVARAFGSRRLARDVVVGAVLAVAIQLAFTRVLGVALPAGVLAALLQ